MQQILRALKDGFPPLVTDLDDPLHVMLVLVLKPEAVIWWRLHDRVVVADDVRMALHALAICAPDAFLDCPRLRGYDAGLAKRR